MWSCRFREGSVNDEEIIKWKNSAEAYFKKAYPKLCEEHLSDFGAYCVEQWLSGRDPRTSREFLAIDYLRSFANCTRNGRLRFHASTAGAIPFGPETDVDERLGRDSHELGRFIESSALRDRRLSQKQRIVLILYYEWGLDLKEIGDVMGVSESRVSQVLAQALREQASRLQAADASLEERERQRRQQEALSREVQKRFGPDEKAQSILERIREEQRQRLAEREIEEVPQSLLGTFACSTF